MTRYDTVSEVEDALNDLLEEISEYGCDQCQAITINGVFCHEHGCENAARIRNFEYILEHY